MAFYFRVKDGVTDPTFILTDYTDESNPVVKTYTATGKSLSCVDGAKCVGIKIAADKFAAATTGTTDDYEWVQLWAGGPKFATMNLGEMTVTGNTLTYAWTATGETDAAATNWSANWRVPTEEQMNELYLAASSTGSDKMSCTYTTYEGTSVYGFLFKGKTTGYTDNSLFLPADYVDSDYGSANYWSGTAGGGGGRVLYLGYDHGSWDSGWWSDLEGYLVRPVLK